MSRKCSTPVDNRLPWINPVGGYGDMLMVSGVLRQVLSIDPHRRYNLVRRTRYVDLFQGHEAIAHIGSPPPDAEVVSVNYWHMEELGPGTQRAYQVLARSFGLDTPVEEALYLPGDTGADPELERFLDLRGVNVIVAPASDSPRKEFEMGIWAEAVKRLTAEGLSVFQVGRLSEAKIPNAYSLRGLTTPRGLVALLRKCDLVVTVDNFVMHAAHLARTPAVAVWGPTQHEVYGYPEQVHLQMRPSCDLERGSSCIVSTRNRNGDLYGTPCDHEGGHCMNAVTAGRIHDACMKALGA